MGALRKLIEVVLVLLLAEFLFAQGNGTCADLTGGDYWFDSGSSFKFTDFSIELWVNASDWTVTDEQTIISCTQSGGYSIGLYNNNVQFVYRNSANNGYLYLYYPASSLASGWHHIAVTHSSTDADLYVDGVNIDGDGSTMSYDPDNSILIGAEATGDSTPEGRYFNGYIDEVRYWNTVLTAEEIHSWRHRIISSDHPEIAYLRNYYKTDTDWSDGWLDDASNNVGGYSVEEDLINTSGATTSVSYAPFAEFPSGYTNDPEALWCGNGSAWTEGSSGLYLMANTPSTLPADYSCVFANNGQTGLSYSDIPAEVVRRSAAVWFMYDEYKGGSQTIDLKFDFSAFGADEMDGGTNEFYRLLRRSEVTGEFSVVATASSVSGGEVTFSAFSTDGDAYYAVGLVETVAFSKTGVTGYLTVSSVNPIDMDGDGDMDIVSSADVNNEISWWENDGSQSFTKHVVDSSFDLSESCYPADMDNDGDIDIVGSSAGLDEIAWWENDGNQSFTKHVIDDTFDGANAVYVDDIDGDGYADIIGAAKYGNGSDVAWWKNDGTPSDGGWTKNSLSDTVNAYSVYSTDIDNDGDIDILSGESSNIVWWENVGGIWTRRSISSGSYFYSVFCADMDGDGFQDVLGAEFSGDAISWWKNDGTPSDGGWIKYSVDIALEGAQSVKAADVDGDGDMDIMAAAYQASDLVWWENNGSLSFTKRVLDSDFNYAQNVNFSDLDGDGDMDILGGAYNDTNGIAWWKQRMSPIYLAYLTGGDWFTPEYIPGGQDQAIGRFYLESTSPFSLIRADIMLSGVRSGYSDFRIWESADESFDPVEDIQLGPGTLSDPGDGGVVVFNKGYTSRIDTGRTYYFLTCDIASDASGTVQAFITDNSSLGFSGGNISGTISNVTLSGDKTVHNLVITSTGTDVNLTWDTVDGVNTYAVYSSQDPYGTFTLLTTVGTNSYTVSAAATKLFYYVTALDSK